MDIIDIILARAKSFTGETATLIQQAQSAMSDANDIVSRLETIEQDAQDASESVQASAEEYETIVNNLSSTINESVAEAVDGLAVINEAVIGTLGENINSDFSLTKTTTKRNNAMETDVTLNLLDNASTTASTVVKNYTTYGDNEDGSMTQKAIKNYVNEVKSTLETQIQNLPSGSGSGGGGSSNLGSENAGSVVIVGSDGQIISSSATEQALIEALIRSGVYTAKNAVGLSIDYENKSMGRTQESTPSTNFSNYSMYGGRMRCNVADDGAINAFYGDSAYKEDGSNGQVMIYQPKFYYQRIPLNTTNNTVGKIIRKESFIISPTAQSGFKLHPAFINENGDEIDYILLSAYEGSAYDVSANVYLASDNSGVDLDYDKLSSVAGVKPISGENTTLTIDKAEQLARNRGEGWHITTMEAYSVDQMLAIIEFGTFDTQTAIENGVCNINNTYSHNYANHTGSTASLGNGTGAAASSLNYSNSVTNNYNENGKRSIAYRGEENPFGNIWKFIGNVNISGNGSQLGGIPYICKNYNYANTITENYESVGFCLPNNSDWISGMGYGDEKYDWVFMPAEASNANSATPIGDSIWISQNLNGINYTAVGGNWLFQQKNGLFYYACDKSPTYYAATFGARLVYIPRKNSIHNNNYALWQTKMGG